MELLQAINSNPILLLGLFASRYDVTSPKKHRYFRAFQALANVVVLVPSDIRFKDTVTFTKGLMRRQSRNEERVGLFCHTSKQKKLHCRSFAHGVV